MGSPGRRPPRAVPLGRWPRGQRSPSLRLPGPLHGATAAVSGDRLLVIGGADRADVSTNSVLALDPRTGRVSPAGTLLEPLHDSAAASLGGRTLVFGGGATTSYDTVQELSPRGSARQVGRLPTVLSDLSAVIMAGRPTYSAVMTASARPRRCFARPTGGASRRRPGFRRRLGTRRRRRSAAGSMPSAGSSPPGGTRTGSRRTTPGPGEHPSSDTLRRGSTTPRRWCLTASSTCSVAAEAVRRATGSFVLTRRAGQRDPPGGCRCPCTTRPPAAPRASAIWQVGSAPREPAWTQSWHCQKILRDEA